MKILTDILIALIAVEHLYILYIEMIAWESLGKRTFRKALAPELFTPTKRLAANQGLYNGFLAAGLIWTFFISNPEWKFNVSVFFLACVILAGIYGGISAAGKIFYIQALPAIIALVMVILTKQ